MQIEQPTKASPSGFPQRQPWRSFRETFSELWEPGDHVSVLARTKGGKSTLVGRGLLPMWTHTITFDVKSDGSVPTPGARVVKRYPPYVRKDRPQHFRLAPGDLGPRARGAFDEAFRKIWTAGRDDPLAGSWTVYVDELKILSDKLRLRDHIETMYIAGRSRGITMIGSTQAPRDVPSDFYDQSTWFLFGAMRDARTLDRLGEISGDRARLRDIVPRLEWSRREFFVIGPGFETITNYPLGRS